MADIDFGALRRSAASLRASDLIAIGLELGWEYRAGRGSHHRLLKPGRQPLVVPEHLSRRVALNIIRDLEEEATDA